MIVDKNFLNNDVVDEIEQTIFSSTFPWFFSKKTSPIVKGENPYQTIRKGFDDSFQINHLLYYNESQQSELYPHFKDICLEFCEKNNIQYRAAIRAKLNITFQHERAIVLPAHIDYTFNHKVFIYYINDSDGDTIIYNEKYENNYKQFLTKKNKISPERGKGVVFNGLHYHSSTVPQKNNYRAILNFVFI